VDPAVQSAVVWFVTTIPAVVADPVGFTQKDTDREFVPLSTGFPIWMY
jgi:hypothetical protein